MVKPNNPPATARGENALDIINFNAGIIAAHLIMSIARADRQKRPTFMGTIFSEAFKIRCAPPITT